MSSAYWVGALVRRFISLTFGWNTQESEGPASSRRLGTYCLAQAPLGPARIFGADRRAKRNYIPKTT